MTTLFGERLKQNDALAVMDDSEIVTLNFHWSVIIVQARSSDGLRRRIPRGIE
jgi:hypothetical protein